MIDLVTVTGVECSMTLIGGASMMGAGLCCNLVNGRDCGGNVGWNGGGARVLVCWVLAE